MTMHKALLPKDDIGYMFQEKEEEDMSAEKNSVDTSIRRLEKYKKLRKKD